MISESIILEQIGFKNILEYKYADSKYIHIDAAYKNLRYTNVKIIDITLLPYSNVIIKIEYDSVIDLNKRFNNGRLK